MRISSRIPGGHLRAAGVVDAHEQHTGLGHRRFLLAGERPPGKHAGAHQLQFPRSRMVAGTSSARTRAASTRSKSSAASTASPGSATRVAPIVEATCRVSSRGSTARTHDVGLSASRWVITRPMNPRPTTAVRYRAPAGTDGSLRPRSPRARQLPDVGRHGPGRRRCRPGRRTRSRPVRAPGGR